VKDDVQEHDLDDDQEKLPPAPAGLPGRRRLQVLVDLERALGQKKEAAGEEDDVPAGDLLSENGEKRPGEFHHPGQRQEQCDPAEHGQGQADDPGPRPFCLRQTRGQDGYEDDVIDAQDDFEGGQRRQPR